MLNRVVEWVQNVQYRAMQDLALQSPEEFHPYLSTTGPLTTIYGQVMENNSSDSFCGVKIVILVDAGLGNAGLGMQSAIQEARHKRPRPLTGSRLHRRWQGRLRHCYC